MLGWLGRKLWGSRKSTGGTGPVQMKRRSRFSSPVVESTREILAEYDAARTTTDNSRHWANADALSADEANSKEVREALRNRARYECQENNSYGKGIVLTIANDTIGTGPRLQVRTANREANEIIERSFSRWAREIGLARKLRTMRLAKVVDGEAFTQLITNRRLRHAVKLDLFLIEADQISSPIPVLGSNAVDGVEFDEFGNPTTYHLLKAHPGGQFSVSGTEFDRVPADQMIHLFRCDRPGQHRGVPEVTPALPLFAQLRRFTLATIAAAETAADFAGVMFTDAPAIAEPDDVEAMDPVELERNAMLTLPRGWKMGQMRAEHPSTTYEMFRSAILNEIARCVNMPFNVAAGNSSGYNFASGRLDHQTYFKAINVEQSEWEAVCLDRVFEEWFDEAVLAGVIPAGLGALDEVPRVWHWDGREHVDPVKEANAQATRLASGTTTYADEYARQGQDAEEQQIIQARLLGVSLEEYRELLRKRLFGESESAASGEDTDNEAENESEEERDEQAA